MTVTIHPYASLKDYFNESFTIELPLGATINTLLQKVVDLSPESSECLSTCRIAIDKNFVPKDYAIQKEEHILLFPPSSGG